MTSIFDIVPTAVIFSLYETILCTTLTSCKIRGLRNAMCRVNKS